MACRPGFFVSAPDVIRVGVAEKVLVSVHNTGNSYIPVTLLLQSTDKHVTYAEKLTHVHQDHPQVVTLQVDPREVETKQTKLSLVVKSEEAFQAEKEILLSFKSGYVFIQTDKPIYTPEHDVKIRVISLDQEMKPSNLPIKLEIRNPQDIIVMQKESEISETGFITESFHFPPHPLFGNWSVVAFYGHKQQQNTSVKFHVEDYVLPTFSVEVKMARANDKFYILPDGADLLLFIEAKTTFDKPVHGSYFIKYSVIQPGGELEDLNASESGKLESDGRATIELKTDNSYWHARYSGKRLQIHVSVTEESSGKTESANNTQVMFVNTPYRFKWDNTVKYFKKGLPFEVKIDVKYANGQPGFNVPVNAVAKAETQSMGQITVISLTDIMPNIAGQFTFTVDVPADAIKITIELETADSGISDIYNARTSFDVRPQEPANGGSYLAVQILTQNIEAGNNIIVELKKTGNAARNTTLYMFVLSKGQIVDHKTTSSVENTIHVDLDATFDMIPHARLLAYFIDENNQVVADSVWFDVTHDCSSDVELIRQDTIDIHKPKDEVQFNINGVAGTQVGLLAIDSSVYLLKDNDKLTEEKMFKKMNDYDLGCGPGGGVNANSIFMDSGVTVITSADLDTGVREDESCAQATARRKRDVASQLSTQYESDSVQQAFCNRGASEHWMNTTACSLAAQDEATAYGLSIDDERIQAFYNCCMIVHQEGDHLTEENEEDHVRSDFPETWIFDQVVIDNFGTATYSIATPDSATTWIVQAIGVSSTNGICVAKPVEVKVQPDFFIQLHMPPAVVRNEQVEIVATVSNYLQQTLEADVTLLGIDGLCSETSPGEWSSPRQFDIPAGDSVLVKFNVVPLVVGEVPLEIMVTTPHGKDTIREVMKVVPEGIVWSHIIQIPLNPTGSSHRATSLTALDESNIMSLTHENIPTGSSSDQKDHINITLPAGAVPDSASLSVQVSGSVMDRIVTEVIGGHTLVSDVELPSGSNGEVIAAATATNVYVLKYLKETGQLTTNVTEKLHQNIQTGKRDLDKTWSNITQKNSGVATPGSGKEGTCPGRHP
ncbi:A.superbus venom factor 1-like [Amphiura filiformis]|uniref:A.superbus venom factor 1-like n=1 Tax=Amphiura filiformis TaxID=82378 RepID=UPI003B21A4D2